MKFPIFIVGYMASGKTTFGRALASRLHMDFIDLDEEIEKMQGSSVAQIIEKDGIKHFRQLESQTLREIAQRPDAIIACGGGTPCHFDNMSFMNSIGTTLRLHATPERIAERVKHAGPTRPLLNNLPDFKLIPHIISHLRDREPFYSKAHISFSGEHLENEAEISAAVDKFINEFFY